MLSPMAAWDACVCVCHQLLPATGTWHIDPYSSSSAMYVFICSNFILVSRHSIRIRKTHQRSTSVLHHYSVLKFVLNVGAICVPTEPCIVLHLVLRCVSSP